MGGTFWEKACADDTLQIIWKCLGLVDLRRNGGSRRCKAPMLAIAAIAAMVVSSMSVRCAEMCGCAVLTPLPTLTGGFDVPAKHVTKEVSVCLLLVYLFIGVGRGTPRNSYRRTDNLKKKIIHKLFEFEGGLPAMTSSVPNSLPINC